MYTKALCKVKNCKHSKSFEIIDNVVSMQSLCAEDVMSMLCNKGKRYVTKKKVK